MSARGCPVCHKKGRACKCDAPVALVWESAEGFNRSQRIIRELTTALQRADKLCTEALPRFNWGASALDANAITLLNEVPNEIKRALKVEACNAYDTLRAENQRLREALVSMLNLGQSATLWEMRQADLGHSTVDVSYHLDKARAALRGGGE